MSSPHIPQHVQPLVDWCLEPAQTPEATRCLYFAWMQEPGDLWGCYTGLLFFRPPTTTSNSRPRFVGWGMLTPTANSRATIPPPPLHVWFARLNIRLDSRYLIAGVTFHEVAAGQAGTASPVDADATATSELDVQAPSSGGHWTLGGRQLQLTKTTVGLHPA
ncbi:hypothetical protein ABIB37_001503 [Agrococcus sp. UYP10]|uniref:hypothetical protein n=1 Tax=Agrococcus sp. UYP10 TaxID=1756355 RepID=UPI003393A868